MGDHAKLIPKVIRLGKKEIVFKHEDLLIRCIPEKAGIFFPEFDDEIPACLIKIFKIENFNGIFMTAWQIGEGIYSSGFAQTWGYDEVKILKGILEEIYEKAAQNSIAINQITYRVIKKEELPERP